MKPPLYLLMVSYERPVCAISVIEDYLEAKKPDAITKFIVVENSNNPSLKMNFEFSKHPDLLYYHFANKNKAAAINFAIKKLISEKEAFIIAVDNDIRFGPNFLCNFYNLGLRKGQKNYFGSSFSVQLPKDIDRNLIPFVQGSAKGKTDAEFRKMRSLMFLGFSYAFFKSQWKAVRGLDERFSPGSKYGLAAEESVFQKKLMYAGYTPCLIEKNSVEHHPLSENYNENNVMKRQENNGFTHGFQDIIGTKFLQFVYTKKLFFFIRRTITIYSKGENKLLFRMTAAYTRGYFKAFLLFLIIKDRKNFLEF